ncbi:F-box domain-containing protein [Mycena kentingensis (nom. inval.)]|nr:F-box domain-containing protein [Mycena kentingensis (nom. inval.)]
MDASHPLFENNDAPTEAQRRQILQLIVDREDEAHRLYDQLRGAREAVGEISQRIKANAKMLRSLQQATAGIRQLPVEILAEIFVHFAVECRMGPKWYTLHKRISPMILARVCSKWRAIVLGTPRIWRSLRFKVAAIPSCGPSPEGIRALLRLSYPHAFSLEVDGREPRATDPQRPVKFTSPILMTLARTPGFSERLQTLSIGLMSIHFSDVVELPAPVFPCLHTFSLYLRGGQGSTTIHEIMYYFRNLPSLRHLKVSVPQKLRGPQYRYMGELPPFQWAQLETLEWSSSLDVRTVHWILSRSTSLRTCKFTEIRFNDLEFEPHTIDALPTMSTLPELEELALSGLVIIGYPLLQSLTLPALKSLDIAAIQVATGVDVLGELQVRSGFGLTTLKLEAGIDFRFIAAFLDANPSITQLSLQMPRNDYGVIVHLTYPLELEGVHACGTVPLPNLTSFTVFATTTNRSLAKNGDDLARMLASRCIGGDALVGAGLARLEDVHVRITGYRMSDEAEEVVEHLAEEGCLQDHLWRMSRVSHSDNV